MDWEDKKNMINKKSLWFITLFSLILVLSVYYVTMPNELLLTNGNNYTAQTSKEEEKNEEKAEVTVKEVDALDTLRVEANEEMLKEMEELKVILTNSDSTTEEKNNAFEKMKLLNITRGEEEELETKIKDEFKYNSFVKIDGDQVQVVVNAEKLDAATANKIMRTVQSKYDKKMYITVKHQK